MAGIEKFKTIGICGGGKMGISFFNYITQFDFHIVFYIRDPQKREKVEKSYTRTLLKKQEKEKVLKSNFNKVIFTENIEELGYSDIIFEFVAEDLKVKRDIIDKLISVKQIPGQIIASGSSSLMPGMIHTDYWSHNIIGVHFFYPVQYINTVEVFYGSKTEQDVIEKIRYFLDYIDKQMILLSEEVGALIIRVFSGMQNEAFKVFKHDNIDPGEIDGIVGEEGFALQPFDLIDSVGFEIISNCIDALYAGTDEYEEHVEMKKFLENEIANGRLGKRTGRGFFEYDGASKRSVGECRPVSDSRTGEEIADRLKMMYLNSCFSLLNDCWVDTVQMDTAMREINQCEKGPVEIAFECGVKEVLEKIDGCSARYSRQFRAPEIIRYIVKHGIGRDEIDRQIRLFNMGGKRPDWHNEDFRKKRKCFAKT